MSNKSKIRYVKPKVQDLGTIAPVYGGTCPTGSLNYTGTCQPTGGIASGGACGNGEQAGSGQCSVGNSPTT